MRIFWATLIFTLSLSAQAEYRVYQYIVKNKIVPKDSTNTGNIVLSSLNPDAYLAYNGGSSLINVDLVRTWICPGSTNGFKNFCPSPYNKLPKGILE